MYYTLISEIRPYFMKYQILLYYDLQKIFNIVIIISANFKYIFNFRKILFTIIFFVLL